MIGRRQAARCAAPALLAVFAAALFVPLPAQAQEEDGQLWFQANTNVPLAQDVRVTLEQIARFSDRQSGLYQSEFGALLGVRLGRGVELGFGYRKVGAHNGNGGADEDRLRQQVIVTAGRLVTRFRVDERFNPRGSEIGFRLRPLVRYNHPLTGRWALFASHESFILPNTTSWGQRRGYDRMRNIIGVAVPVARNMIADIGYLNQYRPARGGADAQMDHALNLQITINLSTQPPRLHD